MPYCPKCGVCIDALVYHFCSSKPNEALQAEIAAKDARIAELEAKLQQHGNYKHRAAIEKMERDWQETWKPLLVDGRGVFKLQKLKAELHDFKQLVEAAGEVYCHVTGGMLGKVTYDAKTVITYADDHLNKIVEDRVAEETKELRERIAELERMKRTAHKFLDKHGIDKLEHLSGGNECRMAARAELFDKRMEGIAEVINDIAIGSVKIESRNNGSRDAGWYYKDHNGQLPNSWRGIYEKPFACVLNVIKSRREADNHGS